MDVSLLPALRNFCDWCRSRRGEWYYNRDDEFNRAQTYDSVREGARRRCDLCKLILFHINEHLTQCRNVLVENSKKEELVYADALVYQGFFNSEKRLRSVTFDIHFDSRSFPKDPRPSWQGFNTLWYRPVLEFHAVNRGKSI
jgi:hypothetical protein